jgi:hypothetical protein
MVEDSTRKLSKVALGTALLALPAFGAGLALGKASIAAPHVPATATSVAWDDLPEAFRATDELGACRRKLAHYKRPRTAPSSTSSVSPEALADAGGPSASIDTLRKNLQTCQHSARLAGAELCRSVKVYFDAMLALPDNGVLCIQRVRIADYIEEDFDKCAAFEKAPNEAELEGYTAAERKTILDAVDVAKTLDADKIRDAMNSVHQRCYGPKGKGNP